MASNAAQQNQAQKINNHQKTSERMAEDESKWLLIYNFGHNY
jgi:hypothetical protein